MNKKRFLSCLLALALLLGVLWQTLPAWAAEVGAGTTNDPAESTEATPTPPEPTTILNGDDGKGNNTPEPESPSERPEIAFTGVSSLEELLQAIDQAEDGAIIGVGCEIVCTDEDIVGIIGKRITLHRIAPEGHISTYSSDGTGIASFQYINFDGGNVDATTPFVQLNMSTNFSSCRFSNCKGGAVESKNGCQFFFECVFENNTAQHGAHIRIDGGSANFSYCVFSGGVATIRAGAIACYTDQEIAIENCSICENTAAQHGGAIWNRGKLTITQSKIHNNTANGEPDDIVNEYQGRLALMDDHNALVALYADQGDIPNKWTVDTFIEDSENPEAKPNMVFSMSFAPRDPEPTPDPIPTPEPTPEPEEPTPTPNPTPSPTDSPYRPSSHSNTTPKKKPEEITLTNGKAVLKAPEALFWVGYEIGQGGAAESVTRAELATLIVSMMDKQNLNEYRAEAGPFDDVEPGSGSTSAIATANSAGIMVGCGNRTFQPGRELTWAELIMVFSRFAGDDAPLEVYTGPYWAKDAINTAISLGWIEYTEAFDPGVAVTCGEMVDFIQTVFQWAVE